MPVLWFFGHFLKYLGCGAVMVIIATFIFTPVGGIITLALCLIGIIPISIQDTKKSIQKREDKKTAAMFEQALMQFDESDFDTRGK